MPVQLHDTEVIKAPVVSEKTTFLANVKNAYTFEVDKKADKGQIKAAIEKLVQREGRGCADDQCAGQAQADACGRKDDQCVEESGCEAAFRSQDRFVLTKRSQTSE